MVTTGLTVGLDNTRRPMCHCRPTSQWPVAAGSFALQHSTIFEFYFPWPCGLFPGVCTCEAATPTRWQISQQTMAVEDSASIRQCEAQIELEVDSASPRQCYQQTVLEADSISSKAWGHSSQVLSGQNHKLHQLVSLIVTDPGGG